MHTRFSLFRARANPTAIFNARNFRRLSIVVTSLATFIVILLTAIWLIARAIGATDLVLAVTGFDRSTHH